jgi:hypothetical protein
MPVTLAAGVEGVVIVGPVGDTVHTPVPTNGVLPSKVIFVIAHLSSVGEVTAAVVGKAFVFTLTVADLATQGAFATVQVNI